MNCQTIKENLSAYIDQALSADEMQQIAKHLNDCPDCRQELAELQKTVALLSSLDEVIPPASFRRELRSKLERSSGRKRFSWRSLVPRVPNIKQPIFASLAVVIVLIVVIPLVFQNTQLKMSDTAKSKSTQNMAANGSVATPPVAPEFTTKGFGGSANSVQTTAGSADLASDGDRGARMSTALTVQDTVSKIVTPLAQERKIIKNADLQLQVDNYQQTMEKVKNQVSSLGGYIANESVNAKDSQGSMRGNLQIRMPYLQFEPFLRGVEGLGKVQNRNIYTQDVTEEFVDVESRLNAMRTKEERLLTILQKTGQLADVLAVENELANTRAELESLEGRLRFLDNRVEYSTVNINIDQVIVPTQTISTGGLQGVFLKAKEAFIKAINNILLDTGKLVVFISSALPYLLILAVLIFLFWRWIRRKVG